MEQMTVVLFETDKFFELKHQSGKTVAIKGFNAWSMVYDLSNTIEVVKSNGEIYTLGVYIEPGPCPDAVFYNTADKKQSSHANRMTEIMAANFNIGDKLFLHCKEPPYFFKN